MDLLRQLLNAMQPVLHNQQGIFTVTNRGSGNVDLRITTRNKINKISTHMLFTQTRGALELEVTREGDLQFNKARKVTLDPAKPLTENLVAELQILALNQLPPSDKGINPDNIQFKVVNSLASLAEQFYGTKITVKPTGYKVTLKNRGVLYNITIHQNGTLAFDGIKYRLSDYHSLPHLLKQHNTDRISQGKRELAFRYLHL